jgi:hypothetical protein
MIFQLILLCELQNKIIDLVRLFLPIDHGAILLTD